MPQEYVTAEHLTKALERVVASHSAMLDHHLTVATRVHGEHQAARAAAESEGVATDGRQADQ